MNSDALKIRAFDFLMDLIYVFIIVAAYIITIDVLGDANKGQEEILRATFVFIAPCSVEGFSILTSFEKQDKNRDHIEVILSVISIIITVVLILHIFFNKNICTEVFGILVSVYPLRYICNATYDFIYLYKERKVKT